MVNFFESCPVGSWNQWWAGCWQRQDSGTWCTCRTVAGKRSTWQREDIVCGVTIPQNGEWAESGIAEGGAWNTGQKPDAYAGAKEKPLGSESFQHPHRSAKDGRRP